MVYINKQILSVNELNTYLKTKLETDELKNIYVTGEISNLTFNKSGHIYFSLKDEKSTISCMIWKFNADKMRKINAKEGMKINCVGKISYYVPYGKVSLEVVDVTVDGIGELQLIYEQRKEELESLGWFDESNKKPLPKYPKNIGIVTADTGAAVHDLITTITRRWPVTNIFLFPSKVQGDGAAKDIAKQIINANNFNIPIDVLIVGRGGGSYEDLWAFNEMETLTAIRNSAIPIISAVGHEPDITLADYVSDKRAATPTAAGELATPSIKEVYQNLIYKQEMLMNSISKIYQRKYNEWQQVLQKNISLIVSKNDMNYLNIKSSYKQLENSLLRKENNLSNKLNNTYNMLKMSIKNILNKMDNNTIKIDSYYKDLTNLISNKQQMNSDIIKNYYNMLKMLINNISAKKEKDLINDKKLIEALNPNKPLEYGYSLLIRNGKVLGPTDEIKLDDELEIKRAKQKIKSKVIEIEKN